MTKPPKPKPLQHVDKPLRSRARKPRDKAQPQLSFDPMPDRIEPCLALLKSKPPSGPDWLYEIKWDGYRVAVHIEPNSVRIITRGGHDWTHRFPAIAQAAATLGPATMILDGEAVVLDEQGRSDFGMLQRSLGASGRQAGKLPSRDAILYAFDILYLDGHDLRAMEYRSRRHLLEDAVSGPPDTIRLSEAFDADPEELLAHVRRLGLEGIIGKHSDQPYRSGRTGDWIKLKCVQSESFIVIGYEPSSSLPGGIGSLLLAAYRGSELQYVGNVGTGFKHDEARRLKQTLDTLKTRSPLMKVAEKNVVPTSPTLIAEIEFRAWTEDGKLRHASYKGLRDKQDNADVYRIGG